MPSASVAAIVVDEDSASPEVELILDFSSDEERDDLDVSPDDAVDGVWFDVCEYLRLLVNPQLTKTTSIATPHEVEQAGPAAQDSTRLLVSEPRQLVPSSSRHTQFPTPVPSRGAEPPTQNGRSRRTHSLKMLPKGPWTPGSSTPAPTPPSTTPSRAIRPLPQRAAGRTIANRSPSHQTVVPGNVAVGGPTRVPFPKFDDMEEGYEGDREQMKDVESQEEHDEEMMDAQEEPRREGAGASWDEEILRAADEDSIFGDGSEGDVGSVEGEEDPNAEDQSGEFAASAHPLITV